MQTMSNMPLLTYQQVRIVRNLLKASGCTPSSLGFTSSEDIPQSEFLGIIDKLSSQAKRVASTV